MQEEEDEDEDKQRLMSKASAIVFCNTCKIAQLLSELLRVFHVFSLFSFLTFRLTMSVCIHSWTKSVEMQLLENSAIIKVVF